jgi:uncharacterized protein (UPF0264 family)
MAPPTRLLVSVVRAGEVEAALEGGADLVDLKNPVEGALGAPEPELLRAVRACLPRPLPLSVALGDAPHLPGTLALAAAGAAAAGADYVKVGLLGSTRADQAVALLRAIVSAARAASAATRVVGVAYADAATAGGLPAALLPRAAADAGAQGVMLDTFRKDGRSTFDVLGTPAVALFVETARGLRLETALAGSLRLEDVGLAVELGADVVGVRGAACVGGRDGRVEAGRVRALRAALEARRDAPLAPSRR